MKTNSTLLLISFFGRFLLYTMGQNRKKNHRINSLLIIYFPTSKGVSKVSGASERANGRASGPVLQSVFLVLLAHCASVVFSSWAPVI